MTWSRIHSAPLRVLPKPRPASSSQVRQSPFGACWLHRPHQPQSCSIVSSSRSLVRFRNAASCSGGSDASNSAGETFSDSDNFDLDRITVRRTGVFVGAGFAPAAARLHPEDRPTQRRSAHSPLRRTTNRSWWARQGTFFFSIKKERAFRIFQAQDRATDDFT